jgi:transposase-like protein
MASVDKISVRNEVDRLKSDFEVLCADGKISSEIKVLMNSMLLIMNLMLTIFLEKKTKKNSENSSIPPSQTDEDKSSLGQEGSKGKGKKENNNVAKNSTVNETVTLSSVSLCDICGESLSDILCQHIERRTKIDIIFEKTIEHVDAEVKQCPVCDSTVKGDFPADMPGPLQYGLGLKAYVINLMICHMVAINRVQKLVKSMIGIAISEATLLKFVLRLHQSLATWEVETAELLLKQQAINVDETSLKVDKKKHWIHVYSSGDITLKFLHKGRGKNAIDSINIIPRYGGVIIHDCLAAYFSYEHCAHGLCGSHLLRELTFIIEANDYVWAKEMKILLQAACKNVSKRKRKKLMKKEYTRLLDAYRDIISAGVDELPPIPPKPSGKRGKIAKSDAHNLLERLQKHEQAVLLFANHSHVSFTNNRAERDLRMAKVKQKVSGCFRTELYAKAYCRISSYLQTMANKGYNPLIAIQMALSGELNSIKGG